MFVTPLRAPVVILAALALAAAQPPRNPKFLAAHQEQAKKRRLTGAEPTLPYSELVTLVKHKIKYVFVLYQENRSFDSYFGTYPGAEGLFSAQAAKTPGFTQPITNIDGTNGTIQPFRIGPREYAADTDDVDHSHPGLLAKMHIQDGTAGMDRYAMSEEGRDSPGGKPTLAAKQLGELTMAYEDCDTVPLLWMYAQRFVLFDHIFQEMTAPSTPGNLVIIGAQAGATQWALHPDEAGSVPLLSDPGPFWGSKSDTSADKLPINKVHPPYGTGINLTYATLPLSMLLGSAGTVAAADKNGKSDLADVTNDIKFLSKLERPAVNFGWYQEGFNREPGDLDDSHAGYVTHHNGPQYFGYVANNPEMRQQLHGLNDFFMALEKHTLPEGGGAIIVKGGSRNMFQLKAADPDPVVQAKFRGDDDHPAYSDAQISEALVAKAIGTIAASPYWQESAIIVTWDDSEGDYDHVPPPIVSKGPDGSVIGFGPRIPFILISPYAKTGAIVHAPGSQSSVIKLIDTVFGLPPLATLPDELLGRYLGLQHFGQTDIGPHDALTPGVTDLLDAFSVRRLTGAAEPLPPEYAEVSDEYVMTLPQSTGLGCSDLGIVTTDRALKVTNKIPKDFNPRPRTNPGK